MDETHRTIQRDKSHLQSILGGERAEERLQTVLGDLAKLWPTAAPLEQRETAKALSHIVGGLIAKTDGTLEAFLGSRQDRLQT